MSFVRRDGRSTGESGVSLLFALVFLLVLSVLIAVILQASLTHFQTTKVVNLKTANTYSADGGVEYAIQRLRTDDSLCPQKGSTATLTPPAINGQPPAIVQCTTLTGTVGSGSAGGPTHALVVTGYVNANNNSLPNLDDAIAGTGPTSDIIIEGKPVFNAGGFDLGKDIAKLIIEEGLDQYNDPPKRYCDTSKAKPAAGQPTVNGTWSCRLAGTFPVPDPKPNPLPVQPLPAPLTPTVSGACTTFYPGKYTSLPAPLNNLSNSKKYYFASGVYYFENVGGVIFQGEVFGGEPAPPETRAITDATPCSTDAAANAAHPGKNPATGSGVALVFGGNSFLEIKNTAKDKVELFSRVPPAGPGGEGTPGVGIYASKTPPVGSLYLASSANPAIKSPGTGAELVVHGLVYLPNSPLVVWALNNVNTGGSPQFAGGVVSQVITIKSDSNSGSGPLSGIRVTSDPADRTILITSTAGNVTNTAVVVVRNDGPRTAEVKSWRTGS